MNMIEQCQSPWYLSPDSPFWCHVCNTFFFPPLSGLYDEPKELIASVLFQLCSVWDTRIEITNYKQMSLCLLHWQVSQLYVLHFLPVPSSVSFYIASCLEKMNPCTYVFIVDLYQLALLPLIISNNQLHFPEWSLIIQVEKRPPSSQATISAAARFQTWKGLVEATLRCSHGLVGVPATPP